MDIKKQYLSIAITVFLIIELIANLFMPIFPPLFLGIWLLILYAIELAEKINDAIISNKMNKFHQEYEKHILEMMSTYEEEKHDRS